MPLPTWKIRGKSQETSFTQIGQSKIHDIDIQTAPWATEHVICSSSERQRFRFWNQNCVCTSRSPFVEGRYVFAYPTTAHLWSNQEWLPDLLPLTTAMNTYGMYSENGIIETCPLSLRLQISCFTFRDLQLTAIINIKGLRSALSEAWIYLAFLTLILWSDMLMWNVLARSGRLPDGIFTRHPFQPKNICSNMNVKLIGMLASAKRNSEVLT